MTANTNKSVPVRGSNTVLRRIAGIALMGVMIALVVGVLVQPTNPIELREQVGGETLIFTADRNRVLLPNTCIQVWWEVSGVERVEVNDRLFDPVGTRDVCVQHDDPPQLRFTDSSGTTITRTLDVEVMLMSPVLWGVVVLMSVSALGAAHLSGIKSLRLPVLLRRLDQHRLWIVAGLYVVWAAFFIYQTSILAWDGARYFSLFDDAMISMRYAHNLAHGHGLVWNAGEQIEGYTNLLMVLLMAVPSLVLSKPLAVLAVQVIGVGIVLGIAYLTMRIAERLLIDADTPHRRLVRDLCFVAPLVYYPVSFWSLLGMETGLLTLLLLVSLHQLLIYLDTERTRHLVLVGVAGAGAYLTRPDSLIPLALVLTYGSYHLYQRGRLRLVLVPLMLIGAGVGGQLLFRIIYYDATVPNTYTLKVAGIPLSARLENGLGFLSAYFRSAWLFGTVIIIGLLATFVAGWRVAEGRERLLKRLLPAVILSALIAYQIYVGGDPWPLWRLLVPGMVLALPLFVVLVFALMSRLSALPSSVRYAGVALILVVGISLLNWAFATQVTFQNTPYDVWQAERNINTALALREATLPEARVAVIMAGTLPYYLDRYTVDMLGKMDPVIAGRNPDLSGAVSWNGMNSVPGHNKYDLTHSIQQLTPGYIPQCYYGQENLCDWVATRYLWRYYEGVELIMLGTSPYIRWDLLQE